MIKLPVKGYDPILSTKDGTITYYIFDRPDNDKTKTVKLPKWFLQCIKQVELDAFKDGQMEVRCPIRKALGI